MPAPDAPAPLSEDQHRLLALLDAYTGPRVIGGGRWLKELALQVAIFDLIRQGVFAHYDFAPTLIVCHGGRRFAQLSQEAFNDLRYLRKRRLVDRVRLSTRYHDITGALRVNAEGRAALAAAPEALVRGLQERLACRRCGGLREPLTFAGPPSGPEPPVPVEGEGALEALWMCARCCARRLAGRPVRQRDPRLCPECRLALTSIPFFAIERLPFATRPHLPPRGGPGGADRGGESRGAAPASGGPS